MIWLLIFALAGIVFFNRYLLLEPRLPIRLPIFVRQALQYSAPCLLTAICGPILLGDSGLEGLASNPYTYAALFSIGCALVIKNMLLSVLVLVGSSASDTSLLGDDLMRAARRDAEPQPLHLTGWRTSNCALRGLKRPVSGP